jgi:protocatechuate 3,4-dioxygenase alpha subunit
VAALTPFQTVGPYLTLGLRVGVDLQAANGTIAIRGQLVDGRGHGIPDGILEWWHPAFSAVLRSPTGPDGSYAVQFVKPLAMRNGDGAEHAPHVAVRVLGRGILTQYTTRLYFPDEPLNQHDAVLRLVPSERRHTLMASAISAAEYRFDVILQGEDETVFFNL